MSLGDHFDDKLKLQYINKHIRPGSIFRFYVDDIRLPKPKYLLLVSADEMLWFFIINSAINDFKRQHPAHAKSQVPILMSDYKFLTKDSFIDCTDYYTKPKQDIKNRALGNITIIQGTLLGKDIQKVKDVVEASVLLSGNVIKKIPSSL